MSRSRFALATLAWLLVPSFSGACFEPTAPEPGVPQAVLDAVADAALVSLRDVGPNGSSPSGSAHASSGIETQEGDLCPEVAVPLSYCPAGGAVVATVDFECSYGGDCCSADPPCAEYTTDIDAFGDDDFVACAYDGGNVVIDGILELIIVSSWSSSCYGGMGGLLEATITGTPSILYQGTEVCSAGIDLTIQVDHFGVETATVFGTICGEPYLWQLDLGCPTMFCGGECCLIGDQCGCSGSCMPAGAVDCCNGASCPPATYCSQCSDSCISVAYPVDCCNGYACPAGTVCSGDSCTVPG